MVQESVQGPWGGREWEGQHTVTVCCVGRCCLCGVSGREVLVFVTFSQCCM